MSGSKAKKPTLSGIRNKTRKRDEKERYVPTDFRDSIIEGLKDVGNDHEQITKYLCDATDNNNKLDVKRYGETLLDVLFVGGIITPGGAIEGNIQTEICLVKQDAANVKSFTNIFVQFLRRYKWLQKPLSDEIKKIIRAMKSCMEEQERDLFGACCAHLLIEGLIPPPLLSGLTQEHLLKDNVSVSFATSLFRTWLAERDMASLSSTLKKASLDPSLQELFPAGPKRSIDQVESYFAEQGLNEMVEHVRSQRANSNRKQFVSRIKLFVNDDEYDTAELQSYISEQVAEEKVTSIYALQTLFGAIANSGEWVNQEPVMPEEFIKELKQYCKLFGSLATSHRLQVEFMNKIQEFCYDNINFLKTFQKIIFMLYQEGDVLDEDAIIEWYTKAHSTKGQSEFLGQMGKMVEWLQNAEEEDGSDDE